MSKFKLDIFDVLNRIDRGEHHLYSTLSDDERKSFAPLVVMRWMSGTKDERQIIFLNELVNPFVFPLGKHQELLTSLLAVASSKKQRRYFWLSAKGKGKSVPKNALKVLMQYHGWSEREAKKMFTVFSNDDIIELANELGWQKEEMTLLNKEMK